MLARLSIPYPSTIAGDRVAAKSPPRLRPRRKIMGIHMTLPRALSHSLLAAAAALSGAFVALLPAEVLAAENPCSGHNLLSKPRPEGSCRNVAAETFVSPDKAVRALVVPASISLDTTPDMESRVVIRASAGSTLTSMDHSSPRGMNGYYVVRAKWSPDSQFFVYSLSSSGGHSPWSFPMMVYSRKANRIAKFSDMINDKPTVSGEFTFAGPHTVTASTWKKPASPEDMVPITVDLEQAFAKLPPE